MAGDNSASLSELETRIDDLENTAEGALRVAQNALQQKSGLEDRIEDLQSEKERLEFRVAELEVSLQDTADADYETLDFDEKVALVRQELMERANVAPTKKAKIDYNDVMWSVFDGKPGAKHCYKLMQSAADVPGFEYNEPAKGNKHVRVDLTKTLDETKAQADFFHENKEGTGEVN